MESLELERTFLAKYLPDDLDKFSAKEICDVYVENKSQRLHLRLRKSDDKYEITRKERVNDDVSRHIETSIGLEKEEFDQLRKFAEKALCKRRYDYFIGDIKFEIDIFRGDLEGLVLVDVEFNNNEAKNSFNAPDFCLADVTKEEFAAGRFLYAKTYDDINEYLNKYNYKKIICKF